MELKPRVSSHVIFVFPLLLSLHCSLGVLSHQSDANCSNSVHDAAIQAKITVIAVDNAHWFACFISRPTVTAVYKHRGHLKITAIVSSLLHYFNSPHSGGHGKCYPTDRFQALKESLPLALEAADLNLLIFPRLFRARTVVRPFCGCP